MLSKPRVERPSKSQHNGKSGDTQHIAPYLGDPQRHLQKAGAPLGHGSLTGAAQEYTRYAQDKYGIFEKVCGVGAALLGIQRGNGGTQEEKEGGQGDTGPKQYQNMPVFSSEQLQIKRAEQNDHSNAPGVHGMRAAHVPLRIIRGQRGDHRADQHFRKAGSGGEDHRTQDQEYVSLLGEKGRQDPIDCQSKHGQHRHDAHRQLNVESMGAKGKDQVDAKLGTEIDQYKRAQQSVGNPVQIVKGDKQQGRNTCHGGHGGVGHIACKPDERWGVFHGESILVYFQFGKFSVTTIITYFMWKNKEKKIVNRWDKTLRSVGLYGTVFCDKIL